MRIRGLFSTLFDWRGVGTRTRARRYTFVGFFLLASVAVGFYRDYVWGHGLRDFGLADSLPNLLAVPAATFWQTGFFDKGENLLVLTASETVGFVIYEFMQAVGFFGTFDWKDIVATFIGFPIAILAHRAVNRAFPADVSA
jgi:hypothetical protein